MLRMTIGMWVRRLLVVGAAFALAGCGGGSGCANVFGNGCESSGGGSGTGTPALASISVALSSQTVTAGTPATVTARALDSSGNAVQGQVVQFTTQLGLGQFSAGSALTNANGEAVVTLTPTTSTASGADVVRATITVNEVNVGATIGFQLTATEVAISSFASDRPAPATLLPYEQTTLQVQLAGIQVGTPVSVVLSSSCVGKGRATLTPETATTSTGVATFTYRDAGCGAFDIVDTVQASVTGTAATASLQLALTAPSASSISFVSADPQTIFLQGSGFAENSNVTFQVRDANGAGVPNVDVRLEPTTLAGGLLIDGGTTAVTKRTDSIGQVLVRVNAGTVPTPVRIKATLVGNTISTVSSSLAVAVGLPSQLNFSLSQQTLNIEGYNLDGVRNTYTIIASDRLGNPVPEGTAINFVTESGQIEAIRMTALSNGLSSAVAQFQSASPRPVDGRMTVLAYALGEESFLDTDGNNVYTSGEDYQDLGDAFIDRLFNGTYDSAEDQFISLTVGGADTCRNATSSLLQLDNSSPSRSLSQVGVPLSTCQSGWGRAYVRRAAQTVLSTSAARPLYGATMPAGARVATTCPNPISLIGSYGADDVAVRSDYYEFGRVALANVGKVGALGLIVADANPVAYNPMAAGTTIEVTSTDGLSSSVLGGSPVPSTLSPSGAVIGYSFDDTTTWGVVTVTFTSPSGLKTTFSQALYLSTLGAPTTTCP